jgi:GNAT superfamily N-acetyltransferase
MMAQPELVAGRGFFDTRVMVATPGAVLAKMGAAGVQGLALPPAAAPRSEAVGCCVKVEDGSGRSIPVVAGVFLRAWDQPIAAAAAEEQVGVAVSRPGARVGDCVPLVEESAFRRQQPEADGNGFVGGLGVSGAAPAPPLPDGLRVTGSDREARDVVRFLRSEWPRADEELLGRAHDWHIDLVVIAARQGRRTAGALRGHLLGGVGTVQELLVAEAWRGRGVGSNLLAAFEDRARSHGCHKVVLRTPMGSRAEGFYRERGYQREYILLGHHFRHDFLGMAKYL